MNMDNNVMSHIHLIKEEMLNSYDWKGNMELLNIILLGISKKLPIHDTRYELNRLIGTLLSNNLKEKEKLDILMQEYNIPVNSELREDVNYMCNLGEGIAERAAARATEIATEVATQETTKRINQNIILRMYRKGYTSDQIAEIAEVSVEDVNEIIMNADAES